MIVSYGAFTGESVMIVAMLQQQLNKAPVPPIDVNSNISPDLSTMIQKSREKK